ncbi:MAG: insulinase family protein [Candidatus Fermentibacter sp.]|nr:insulinase family protein [Candidatus Fermentibacter sp.]
MSSIPVPGLPPGFEARSSGVLLSWGIPWVLLRDTVSGAGIMHVGTDASDHFLGISLLTPPRDSSGIPHILEHCVLNGSESYPVRDAFNELWRGSLHTHLNAVTYPDRTVYFTGSTHPGEFRNLASVYLDLVFRPILDRRRMLLESFHLRPDRRGRSLLGHPSGVIYSEMRGSYSDPGELAYLKIQSELLPDTPYRNDSGGDPSAMGGTTWEDVRDYHSRHYTPSNALVFVCSPMGTGEIAEFIRHALPSAAPGSAEPPGIPLQPRWKRPRRVRLVTPREPGGASVSLSWLLGESGDAAQAALAQILEDVLLSDAGSLYRVLLDCGLGADISAETGLELEMREMVLTAGLRDTSDWKADPIRRVILGELSRFADSGPDPDVLDAAVNSLLFAYRDRVEDFPLALFTRATRAWAYGLPPEGWLDHAAVLSRLASGGGLRGKLGHAAKVWLVDNPHRLQLLVDPVGRSSRRERVVRLDSVTHGIISTEARELDEFSALEDSPEALRSIPRLPAGELPLSEREPEPLAKRIRDTDLLLVEGRGSTAWMELAFDIADLSEDDDTVLPLLLCCLTGLGAGGLGHAAMSVRIARDTGGIDPRPAAYEHFATRKPSPVVSILAGFFPDRPGAALEVLRSALVEPGLDAHGRLWELVEEQRGEGLSALVSSGDWYARLSAAALLSRSCARRNTWEGLPQWRFIDRLSQRSMKGLSGRLSGLYSRIFTRDRLSAVSCSPGAEPARFEDALSAFIDSLPAGAPGAGGAPCVRAAVPAFPKAPRDAASGAESASAPPAAPPTAPRLPHAAMMRLRSDLSTVCIAMPAPGMGDPAAAMFTAGTAAFADGPAYRRLRVAGGAYEVSAWHDPMSGLAYLMSNRDPDPARARAFFAGAPGLLRASPPSAEDVRLAVLSAFAGLEQPMGPRVRCSAALARHLSGVGRADLEALRRSLAEVEHARLAREYPEMLEKALESSSTFVFAPMGASVEAVFGRGAEVTVLPSWR